MLAFLFSATSASSAFQDFETSNPIQKLGRFADSREKSV